MSHPLHTSPRCRADDLGAPIPESLHAVSVCLPTWQDVVGYEEKDPRVTTRMRTGYPRFFLHPLIEQVRRELRPKAGRDVLPFGGRAAAEECARLAGGTAVEVDGIHAAFFPQDALPVARGCWQHAGRGLSSRAAAEWLAHRSVSGTDETLATTIRQRLAAWSGADPSMVSLHPSGMAAIHAAFRAVTARRPGRSTVMFGFPYTDTLKILRKFGPGVEFFENCGAADLDRLADLLGEREIAGIFCEFPGNPLLQCPDLPALHALARRHGVPVVVDDTIGTPFNVDVLPHADLVATSLTKAVSGEGDVMAGALTFHPGLEGLAPPPCEDAIHRLDLEVLERNSRDFEERMRVCNANALALAELLEHHPAVEKTWYPGLGPSPAYEALRKPNGGHGTVLSFLPRDAEHTTPAIYERLRVNRGISLGTSYTLACPYVQLAHYHELDWARSCGIDPFLLRVSAGMEPVEDLTSRFLEALRPMAKP
jgi:cystathionine gamma-synthase